MSASVIHLAPREFLTLSTADLVGERYRRGGPVGGIGAPEAPTPVPAARDEEMKAAAAQANARWPRLRPLRAGDRRGGLVRLPAGVAS